jgi:hypothetical protein
MKTVAIRRPVSGARLGITLPAVPLRSAACFIPPRTSGAQQRRRRGRLKPGVKRSETPGHVGKQYFQPLKRGDGKRMLKVTLVERQTMPSQYHLELFEERNRSVMFFLSFDVTTHLRNLRFTHRERAISFLPRESCGFSERSRNPAGRIRLQFTDEFRDRFVMPQFRENVNVIGSSIHDYRDAIFRADSPAKVLMNSRTDGSRHPRLATLCRKDDVIEEIAIGGTHRNAPFRRPSSGALIFSNDTPGVPLRSTPSCSFAALHCRLYSAAPSALSSIRRCPQRQRRAGLEPGAKRSAAPGSRIKIIENPWQGVAENAARISASAQ